MSTLSRSVGIFKMFTNYIVKGGKLVIRIFKEFYSYCRFKY